MHGTGLKDFLTIGCAVLGAGLGVINAVTNLNLRRVKLRVTPKFLRSGSGFMYSQTSGFIASQTKELPPNGNPAIEVINLSAFPVTISEAGFKLKGEGGRIIPKPPFIFDNKPWPRRLDSRESVTVYFQASNSFPKNLHVAYATTDCATTRSGDSPALKKFRAQLQKGSL